MVLQKILSVWSFQASWVVIDTAREAEIFLRCSVFSCMFVVWVSNYVINMLVFTLFVLFCTMIETLFLSRVWKFWADFCSCLQKREFKSVGYKSVKITFFDVKIRSISPPLRNYKKCLNRAIVNVPIYSKYSENVRYTKILSEKISKFFVSQLPKLYFTSFGMTIRNSTWKCQILDYLPGRV